MHRPLLSSFLWRLVFFAAFLLLVATFLFGAASLLALVGAL